MYSNNRGRDTLGDEEGRGSENECNEKLGLLK